MSNDTPMPPSIAPSGSAQGTAQADADDTARDGAGQDCSPASVGAPTAPGGVRTVGGSTSADTPSEVKGRVGGSPFSPTREGAAAGAAGATAPAAATTAAAPAAPDAGPRRVRLAVSRVDPWSVMKLSFLLSVAIGVMIVVAAAVVWGTLDALHVFTSVDEMITEIVGPESSVKGILEYVEFNRVMSLATLIAVVDVVILTALSTIMAFLYNITAALVGGLHVTLTDD